ncbi:hypothetical protein [Providencia alcalifaciens]|uniref:phage tail fiber protein n=1 Tax=Providencia alcalifaciens TaxID=126385 RepID=UPI0012B515D8|nr:hypothetical protein [Providencia alcalifaciens]MTB33323.1 hypothetical protein [Providencia alcalifaciens]
MIYQTGTITTTAGQTKITGAGTRWKDNLAGISEGCPISYLINNTVFMNTVLSVNSDTEINLTYPVPVAASAAKYQIATYVLDSMSDGVRKMLANQQYIGYFLRNMDAWLTQDGIVEIKTPTGETVKLESIIALKKLIDGKLSLTGGVINKDGEALAIKNANEKQALFYALRGKDNLLRGFIGCPSDTDRIALVNSKTNKALTLTEAGAITYDGKNIVLVGDYGIGGSGIVLNDATDAGIAEFLKTKPTQFWRNQSTTKWNDIYSPNMLMRVSDTFANICVSYLTGKVTVSSGLVSQNDSLYKVSTVYTTLNTTKDANGNLKAASPVIKVFSDHAETNDESEGVEVEKLDIGRYKLKGTLGMNSDASWGGIHGGLVVPNGINNLPLVWADFDVLPDGDIIIETRYRKHTLHPRLEAQRLMTYPEFLDENNVEREDYDYCDIPNGHWIDVRVNMPSDSIYNLKLAEAEQLAKIEAERVAKEEAEKAAREEAERLEEESKQEQASKLEE